MENKWNWKIFRNFDVKEIFQQYLLIVYGIYILNVYIYVSVCVLSINHVVHMALI